MSERRSVTLEQLPDGTAIDLASTEIPGVVEITTRAVDDYGMVVRIPAASLIGLVTAVAERADDE